MLQKFFIYKKQKIKDYWQTFQFYKPIYPWDDQGRDANELFWFHQHAPCYRLLLENFLRNLTVDSDSIYGYNTDRASQS